MAKVRTLPVPQTVPGSWRIPAVLRLTGRFCRRKPLGAIGGVLILALLVLAVFADRIAPYTYDESIRGARMKAPSVQFWMGTDNLGRDIWSRVVYGARISVTVGFATVALATLMATLIGISSAYLGAANASRVIRGATLSVMQHPYVEAARALGAGHLRIVTLYVLPNVMATILILATIGLGTVILAESGLSFLGFGVPPPYPSWGGMLSGSGRSFMYHAPWMALWPAAAISLAVFGFNMLGDALRDVLDPRLRGGAGAGR
jgi:peptide/nickel transport system permease protein